jgi:hypothetical protein
MGIGCTSARGALLGDDRLLWSEMFNRTTSVNQIMVPTACTANEERAREHSDRAAASQGIITCWIRCVGLWGLMLLVGGKYRELLSRER